MLHRSFVRVRRVLQLMDAGDLGDESAVTVLPMAEAEAVMGETVAAYLDRVAWRFAELTRRYQEAHGRQSRAARP